MLRLSRMADYAVVVMLRLAAAHEIQTSTAIAMAIGIPEPTVAKVLKSLASAGLTTSVRGARGGYRRARAVSQVSVADVIGAVDGPIALTACVDGAPSKCDVSGMCALHGRWDVVNDAVREALASISLAALRATPARVPQASVATSAAASLPAE